MQPRTPQLLLNRELSWLEFNARVLHEALDERNPLLERFKFLAISASNLDEFYMVRVAGLRRQAAMGLAIQSADGLTAAEQLEQIDRFVRKQYASQQRCLHELLLPALAEHDVRVLPISGLSPEERQTTDAFFEREVFPVLTPLAVDPGHPFPYISNLSISLAVSVRNPQTGAEHFARVKVPESLPRWVPIGRPSHFVSLEDVIRSNLGSLFAGMEVLGAYAFRITRYSDLEIGATEEADDLLTLVQQRVFERRFGEVVRLELQEGMPPTLRELIVRELREEADGSGPPLSESEIFVGDGILALSDLLSLASLDCPELRDRPFVPLVPPELRDTERSIFDVIRERDLLVHHPFESFTATVERFLAQAAVDPNVLAIKLTLYRTSGDTEIVNSLLEAARRGKQVAVMVELKARFDEENNIAWARTLEDYGVHVGYGSPALKTHGKIALVVRREHDGICRYVHIGTGNYNSRTARVYTDLGLFTSNPAIGADTSDLFNSLTGFALQRPLRTLLVAPSSLRERVLALIQREAEHARAGAPARIIAKMNALADPATVDALYAASAAGVEVDLIVRGICTLRPGIPGVSDRIRVRSIIGRFLEHSRLWMFENGGTEELYMGSADWMMRNFDRRVEVVTSIEEPTLRAKCRSLLALYLSDNRQAWELDAEGVWHQCHPAPGEPERASHRLLLNDPWGMGRASTSTVLAGEAAANTG